MTLSGQECRCLGLDRPIEVKRAAGRPKDPEAVAELEALRENATGLGIGSKLDRFRLGSSLDDLPEAQRTLEALEPRS